MLPLVARPILSGWSERPRCFRLQRWWGSVFKGMVRDSRSYTVLAQETLVISQRPLGLAQRIIGESASVPPLPCLLALWEDMTVVGI